MCGIAGYFGLKEINLANVQATLRLMQRRGPDNQSHEHFVDTRGRHCHLLHSRLSIIDLDHRSNQPLHVDRMTIIFNGELYNYREVRAKLAGSGYRCRTESDTEVMLAAIQQFSWSVLDECEGMWAFAVYDQESGSLTLCRDRFGEKPLYVYRDPSGIYFASEVKFIRNLLGSSLTINDDHLSRYLVNGYRSLYKQIGQSFFRGISELPSASTLHVDATGGETRSVYWRAGCRIDPGITLDEAVDGARARLTRAVELRLRADVPIAFCMSGGVDSNSLISIAKNVFHYDVHGFTIVNSDARYEEQDVIEQSVAELGIRHTNIPVDTTDFLPKLRTLVRQHDAPVYTITYFAHWLLMEAVAQHGYRISVSGTAADELFTGYYDHHLFFLAAIQHEPDLLEAAQKAWRTHIQPIVRNPHLSKLTMFVEQPQFREHLYMNADRFASYLTRDWSEAFFEQPYTNHLLRNRMLNELFHEITPVILHEDDLNAMYFSIENRSPFLDRELFEFCFSLPTEHLIRDGYNKAVLRDAMRGIVPDCVLDTRRKVGFNAPIFSFLDVHDTEVREYLLDRSPIFERVRRDKIEELICQPDLPNSESKFLFNFLTSKMFLEENGGSVSCTPTNPSSSIALRNNSTPGRSDSVDVTQNTVEVSCRAARGNEEKEAA